MTEKKKQTNISGGVILPTITIFNNDDSIDYEGTKEYIYFLLENDVDGLLSLGTTQENATFTEEEYRKLVKTIVETVNGRVPVYIGVTSPATHISISNAKYAQDVGADAIFSAAPYCMKLLEEEIMEFHRDVASSVDIPYLLYNNPGLSKTGLSVQQIADLTQEGVVSMIKDTTGDPVRMLDFKMTCKEGTKVFFGDDYGAYQALTVGIDGWTSGIANLIPKECKELWLMVAQNKDYEEGLGLWKTILPVFNATMSPFWLQVYKEGVKARIGTSSKCRKPLFDLPEEDKKNVSSVLKSLGY